MNNLFQKQDFTSHSGLKLDWKIDCAALTDEDLSTLACLASQKIKFREVIGVPTGGLRFQEALKPYAVKDAKYKTLVVDDVLTTGKSLSEYMDHHPASIGLVIFDRAPFAIPVQHLKGRKVYRLFRIYA